jgi:DNA-binding response OmpR family regulator
MASISIYEENDLMRALLKEWLSKAGYRVCASAASGGQRGGTVDLVVVNVCMPKQAGVGLVQEIQKVHPDKPLIAISSQFRAGLSPAGATARALGVQRVIAKPLSRDELLEAVSALIGAPN